MIHQNRLRVPILVSLCLCIVAWAPQAWAGKKTKEEKRQEQEEESSKKEGKKHVEQAKKYATLTEFADDLYATDPDFRDQVDQAYRDLQSRHALEAFRINTSKSSEIVAIEGDEFNIRRALYDNPRIQDYVNRVGQRLVPADSEKLFAFKVTQSPIPYAYTLSTGTVYISTGLISLTDNEAQLAYVLSHELAHVYKDHWKTKVMTPLAEDEYNKKQLKKRAMWGAIFAGAGAAVGGAFKGGEGAAIGAMTGLVSGYVIGSVLSKKLSVDWDYVQENQADEFGLKNTLDENYDIQEVPKFYLALKQASAADQRVGLGFIAQSKRIKDRMEYANKEIQGTLQADYQTKLKAGQLVGTSPDYQLMMAELKRDNGVIAFAFDMFGMARQNLRQAVNLRSDDARAHFYYAKVMKLTARNDTEKTLARGELLTAIKLDEDRHAIPEAELQRAVMLMDNPDSSSQAEATQALKNYIVSYQESQVQGWKYSSSLPPNMDILDDYLRLLGEPKWKPPFPELYRVLAPDVVAARTTPGLVPASVPGASQGTASTPVVPAKAESPRK